MAALRPDGGVTAMILDHSNLLRRQAGRWLLLLEESHVSMLNDARRREIAALASEHEGRQVVVEFQLGKTTAETPGERRTRCREADRRRAEETLLEDAGVQALLREFDGRLESAQRRDAAAS